MKDTEVMRMLYHNSEAFNVVNNGVYKSPTLTCEEGGELPIIEEVK